MSKAGTYDVIVQANGQETKVYIIEDEPTYMIVKVLDTKVVMRLQKPTVQ